jgi:hypothetical protein
MSEQLSLLDDECQHLLPKFLCRTCSAGFFPSRPSIMPRPTFNQAPKREDEPTGTFAPIQRYRPKTSIERYRPKES